MAKRKRLSPPDRDSLADPDAAVARPRGTPFPVPPGDQAKRVPIADIAGAASAQAALADMADRLGRARAEGRMVVDLPLAAIDTDYLVRDRVALEDAEMAALVDSLRQRGQQTPVEVVDLGEGRYGLISGWRRCKALNSLYTDTGEAKFATVQALLRQPSQSSEAYVAMVEENEIRVGLSHYERARIVARTTDQGVFETETAALRALFSTASRAKRSKIGSFVTVVRALDGVLRFPEALGERVGLRLAKALAANDGAAGRISAALGTDPATTAEEEQARLARVLAQKGSARPAPPARPETPAISLQDAPDGSLRLSGPGVDAAFRARLAAWIDSL